MAKIGTNDNRMASRKKPFKTIATNAISGRRADAVSCSIDSSSERLRRHSRIADMPRIIMSSAAITVTTICTKCNPAIPAIVEENQPQRQVSEVSG